MQGGDSLFRRWTTSPAQIRSTPGRSKVSTAFCSFSIDVLSQNIADFAPYSPSSSSNAAHVLRDAVPPPAIVRLVHIADHLGASTLVITGQRRGEPDHKTPKIGGSLH